MITIDLTLSVGEMITTGSFVTIALAILIGDCFSMKEDSEITTCSVDGMVPSTLIRGVALGLWHSSDEDETIAGCDLRVDTSPDDLMALCVYVAPCRLDGRHLATDVGSPNGIHANC